MAVLHALHMPGHTLLLGVAIQCALPYRASLMAILVRLVVVNVLRAMRGKLCIIQES